MSAMTFAAEMRACPARGLAPILTYFFAVSEAHSPSGWVAEMRIIVYLSTSLATGDLVCRLAHLHEFFLGAGAFGNFRHRLLRHVDDLYQFVDARVRHVDFEHEAVHLRFGKRICTVLLDGVLRGKHEERFFQLTRKRP